MFKKGDIVIAKDKFLEEGESLKDTLGIIIDYNPENDYLLLGVLHPEKFDIPPTFSMRGEFYRKVTDTEMIEFGIAG